MTSQYFGNLSNTGDGWNDEWGDFNDDNTVQANNQNVSSPNQNTVFMQQPLKNQPSDQQQQQQHQIAAEQNNYNNNAFLQHQSQSQVPPMPQQQTNYYQQQPIYNPNENYNQPMANNWGWNANSPPPLVNNQVVSNDESQGGAINREEETFPHVFEKVTRHHPTLESSSIPDDYKNTQLNLQNPILARVKRTDPLLTPQWSIESQMSSSDRSVESDNMDGRSSATNTSDENNKAGGYEDGAGYSQLRPGDVIDSLDQALLNINATAANHSNAENAVYQREQEISPTAKVMAGPPPRVSNIQPPSGNPFKRASHVAYRAQPVQQFQPPAQVTNFYADNPDNAEVLPDERPSNERNQYLQTGHLSAEVHDGGDGSEYAPPVVNQSRNDPTDNLPPPGLSRYVLGQPESEDVAVVELPPSGLDRMVPGTELPLARQADGQAANISPPVQRITDRNLYQVPGESISTPVLPPPLPSQRIVPGVEHENFDGTVNVNDQQREQEMDGENVDDRPNIIQHQPEVSSREEPIEGANTLDDQPPVPIHSHGENDLSLIGESGRKDISNPSTANDDSDKDRYYKSSRRGGEEPLRRKKKSVERYDTEDTDYYSDKDRRRYQRDGREGSVKDGDRKKDRERDRDRYYRDRDRDRDRERDRDRYETDGSKYERRYDRDERDEDRRKRRDERRRDDRRRDERRRDDRYATERKDRRDRPNRGERPSEYGEGGYNRTGSRNGSERDPEKDRRYQSSSNYYGAGQGGYSYDPSYLYYQQHQQYYAQLRQTNPQAYAEWFRKYYSQMQTQVPAANMVNTDGRESVNSGRSSTNGKDLANNLETSLTYPDSSANLSHNVSYNQQSDRMTPLKYNAEHCLASISSGPMVCLKSSRYFTSNNGAINTVKIVNISINDSTRRLFNAFPGPLVRGVTHKKTVIEFCEEQIRYGSSSSVRSRGNSVSSLNSMSQGNRPSFVLMWKLLILLLRQNGMVVGTDISELLLTNQSEFPYDSAQPGGKNNGSSTVQPDLRRSRENQTPSDDNGSDEVEGSASGEGDDFENRKTVTEEEAVDKFRSNLLYGNVNEALDWATDNNLWGHALFLASKMNRRAHANVMMKFANKLALNDPLQTLFQLMSGKVPSAVTSVQDEKWGDWRSHLAMILANTSQKPELDRKAITTLGDSLYNRGDLFGAQFCYLMSQVGFGKYTNVNQESVLMVNSSNTIRLILLGSSHHKSFKEFATNEAIMMTEIYEYACTLNDDTFSIAEFQPYKHLLATRMLDYGLHFKTLMYMEQISHHIQKDPTKYEPYFIERVFILGDRLKFYDPALEKTVEELTGDGDASVIENQKWLEDLKNLSTSNSGYVPQYETQHSHESNDPNYQSQDMMKQQIDQQFVQINQQFSELNMQYAQNTADTSQNMSAYSENYQWTNQDAQKIQQLPDQPQQIQDIRAQPQNEPVEYYEQQQHYNSPDGGIYGQQVPAESYDYWNNGQQSNEPHRSNPSYASNTEIKNKYDVHRQSQQHNKTVQELPPVSGIPSSLIDRTVDGGEAATAPPVSLNTLTQIQPPPPPPSSLNIHNEPFSSKPPVNLKSNFTNGVNDVSNTNSMVLRKRVNFKLSSPQHRTKDHHHQQQQQSSGTIEQRPPPPSSFNTELVRSVNLRKSRSAGATGLRKEMCPLMISRETKYKNVVYNGTYPIDDPISSRFSEDCDGEDGDDGEAYEDFDKYEEGEYADDDDDDEEEGEMHPSYTIKELIQNKNISLNYNKMKYDFEKSFKKFDQILDRRKGDITTKLVSKSFNIDEPI